MNENVKIVYKERLGSHGDAVKLMPMASPHDISLVPCLLQEFEEEFKREVRNFFIDLSYLQELPPSLIVALFEFTARVRRVGGDVTIANLKGRAWDDLQNFSALNYLNVTNQELEYRPEQLLNETAKTESPVDGAQKSQLLTIPARIDDLYIATNFVVDLAEKMGFPEAELSKIKIAVYEACLNVIEHAYHSDPNEKIQLRVEMKNHKLVVEVFDRGKGFEVKDDDFDIVDAAKQRKTGGMGLHIIRRSMDQVSYEIDPVEGNKLIMVKNL